MDCGCRVAQINDDAFFAYGRVKAYATRFDCQWNIVRHRPFDLLEINFAINTLVRTFYIRLFGNPVRKMEAQSRLESCVQCPTSVPSIP
jgi:hypothetical protein